MPQTLQINFADNKFGFNVCWNEYSFSWVFYQEEEPPCSTAHCSNSKLWKRFGPLHIYVPPKEYILALKITAGRDKDLEDCAILLPQTKIETYEQAQQLLDRYILPEAQQEYAEQIERSLNKLFKNQ